MAKSKKQKKTDGTPVRQPGSVKVDAEKKRPTFIPVPPDLYAPIKQEAREQGLTAAGGVRRALEFWLQHGPTWRKFLQEHGWTEEEGESATA